MDKGWAVYCPLVPDQELGVGSLLPTYVCIALVVSGLSEIQIENCKMQIANWIIAIPYTIIRFTP
jgi:hypothetical protein